MRRKQVTLTDYGPAPGRLDAAAEWLLVGLLAFMPLALGTVEAWSEFVATAAALALAVLLVARRVARPDYPGAWTWAYVPVALYVLLALLQLAPLPESIVRAVSPETLAAKARLLADLPQSAGDAGAAGSATLSFYALATRHDLRVVLIAATIFVAVVEVYRRPEQVRRLLLAVTCVGAAVAALALAQHLTRATAVYWTVPTPLRVADGGPFINHNHFAQFMNLSVGAALGLLFVKLRDLRIDADLPASEVAAALREPEARPVWFYGSVFVAGAVGVFLSMSRGGMVGMLAGLALVAVVAARQRRLRGLGWVVAVLALASFAALLYFGFDAVYDRVAAVRDLPEAAGGRWELVLGAMEVWRKFPVLGTGLGTHAWVFPAYDRTGTANLAQYVENEYVQALEETGVVGLILVLAFAAAVWVNYFRAARAERPRVCGASHGLAFGLLAVTVHSLSDFGQHVPAVAGLTAATCGLMVVLARLARRAREARAAAHAPAPEVATGESTGPAAESAASVAAPVSARPLAPSRRLAVAAPLVAAVLLGWALLDANASRVGAAASGEARRVAAALARDNWEGSDDDYTLLLTRAQAAVEARPDDVEGRYWLNAYRWRAIARERDPETGELLLTEEALGFTARVVEELHSARRLCPTFGPPVSLAGQLEAFVLGLPQGRERIALAYALAPNHPDVVFTAALADADRGDWDASVAKFERCLKLAPLTLREVIDVFETQYDRPDLAVRVAARGANPTELMQLSSRLRERGGHEEAAKAARDEGVAALERICASPDAYPQALVVLAAVYRADGRPNAAVPLYRRALALDYGQVDWRLELARTLAAAGKRGEALREAQICLRLRPAMEAARQLVGDLSVPVTTTPLAPVEPPGPASPTTAPAAAPDVRGSAASA